MLVGEVIGSLSEAIGELSRYVDAYDNVQSQLRASHEDRESLIIELTECKKEVQELKTEVKNLKLGPPL